MKVLLMTLETAFLLCWVKHFEAMKSLVSLPFMSSSNSDLMGWGMKTVRARLGFTLPPDGATCLFPVFISRYYKAPCCIGNVFWADWEGSLEEIFGRAGIFAQWPLTSGKQNKYSHPLSIHGDWFQDTTPTPVIQNPWMFKSLYTMGKNSWPLVSVGSASVGLDS